MESHIDRLTAACGLRHFSYRTFGAPEIVVAARPIAAEEPEAAPVVLEAAASPPPAPMVPAAPLPVPVAPGSPPLVLAHPPEEQAPGFGLPNLNPPARQPPVRLPPPDWPAASARPARSTQSARPPVLLPPPDALDPIIAFRGRDARAGTDRRATPPPAARREVQPRRFALLDEIASPAGRPPVMPERRATHPLPPGRS